MAPLMERRIMSTWQQETARFDGKSFVDRKHGEKRQKELTMTLEMLDSRPRLRFISGPTGYESYYADDAFVERLTSQLEQHKTFCICAGTINSWPEATVPLGEVVLFLADAMIAGVLK